MTKTIEAIWLLLQQHQGETFHTAKGLPFTYTIRGGGPKKIGCYGASYLYPVLLALDVLERPALPGQEEFTDAAIVNEI